jgi:biotin transporter BioY
MKNFIKLIVYFLIGNLIFYVLGIFVTYDINPLNWFLIACDMGRAWFLFIEFIMIIISYVIAVERKK